MVSGEQVLSSFRTPKMSHDSIFVMMNLKTFRSLPPQPHFTMSQTPRHSCFGLDFALSTGIGVRLRVVLWHRQSPLPHHWHQPVAPTSRGSRRDTSRVACMFFILFSSSSFLYYTNVFSRLIYLRMEWITAWNK